MEIDIFELYEDLKKHIGDKYDDAFYEADEGDYQYSVIQYMLEEILDYIKKR